MSFIGLWITTTITSYVLDLGLGLKLFKDLADQGYKINVKRFNELRKELNMDNSSTIIKFIPFLNILNEMRKSFIYNQQLYSIKDKTSIKDRFKHQSRIEVIEHGNIIGGKNQRIY